MIAAAPTIRFAPAAQFSGNGDTARIVLRLLRQGRGAGAILKTGSHLPTGFNMVIAARAISGESGGRGIAIYRYFTVNGA